MIKHIIVVLLFGTLSVKSSRIFPGGGCWSLTSTFNAHSIALDSKGNIHILWQDAMDTSAIRTKLLKLKENNPYDFDCTPLSGSSPSIPSLYLYYSRSTDKGVTWEEKKRFSGDYFDSYIYGFDLNVDDKDAVHVVWVDSFGVHYKYSPDEGTTWLPDTLLIIQDTVCYGATFQTPLIRNTDSLLHFSWVEVIPCTSYTKYKLFYSRSTNRGISWSKGDLITTITSPIYTLYPSISTAQNSVYWVWHADSNKDSLCEVYFRRSIDNGISWEPEVKLSPDSLVNIFPNVVSSDSFVFIGWMQGTKGDSVFIYRIIKSSDRGATWSLPTCLITEIKKPEYSFGGLFNLAIDEIPQVNLKNNIITVMWGSAVQNGANIYLKYSKDRGMAWSDSMEVGHDTMLAVCPSAAIDEEGVIRMLWTQSDGVYYGYQATGVEEDKTEHQRTKLKAFPAVFKNFTTLTYQIPAKQKVSLVIYDITGRNVEMLLNNEEKDAGTYLYKFYPKGMKTGIYFAKLITKNSTLTQKLILVK